MFNGSNNKNTLLGNMEKIYSIQGNIFPRFFFLPLLSSLSEGDFKTGQIPKSPILYLKTQMAGRMKNWAKMFASVLGRKLHRTKITLYKVDLQEMHYYFAREYQ